VEEESDHSGVERGRGLLFQDIFQGLACPLCFEEMLDRILDAAQRELEADDGSVLVISDADGPPLTMLAARGLPAEVRQRGYVSGAGSVSERVLAERRPVIIHGPLETPSDPPSAALASRLIQSALCLPLIVRGRALGTMNLNRTRAGAPPFSPGDLKIAQVAASQAAMVIENHRLEQELQNKERLATLGQVAAGIAHCIKNLLAGVEGGLALVRKGIDADNWELAHKGHEVLSCSLTILSNLILDLLDVSKKRIPVLQPADARDLLESISALIGWKAQAHGVELVVDVPADFVLWADPHQITRALLNIALNAIEACAEEPPQDGRCPCVRLGAQRMAAAQTPLKPRERRKAAQWAVIEVADNGPDIGPDALPHLWDLFFSTKGSRGTGIGLPAARKVVEEHGGHILVETRRGAGTTFAVYLPAVVPPGAVPHA
jgi:signal transduction histidine kinase